MLLTVLYIILSFLLSAGIYALVEKLFSTQRSRSLVSVVLVNLVPLVLALFSEIDVKALILAYIIETIFISILSIYEILVASVSKWIRLFALKRILFTTIPGAVFYLLFFAAFAFNSTHIQEGYVSEIVRVDNLDMSWLTNHLDQFLITLTFFASYYLYLAVVDLRDEHIDRQDLDQRLKHMALRDNIMFFSTFIFAFLLFIDSRILLVIMILVKTIASVVAILRQYSTTAVSEFIWVDVAEHLWNQHKNGNNAEKQVIVMRSESSNDVNT